MKNNCFLIAIALAFLVVPLSAHAEDAVTTTPDVNVTLHVRYYDEVAFAGSLSISATGTVDIMDNLGAIHAIPANTAFSAMKKADALSDAFQMTDVSYYPAFDSLFLNCVHLQNVSTTPCYNWKYTVNDVSPIVAADRYTLMDGDDVYLYFGIAHRLTLPQSSVDTDTPFTSIAEQYKYRTNEWLPLPSVTIGATRPDPNNPWSPIVIATSTTDASGAAVLTVSVSGIYDIGIAEDYYYPTVPLTVSDPNPAPDAPVPQEHQAGGSPPHRQLNNESAIRYLKDHQESDGSILHSPLYSDWAAFAYAAVDGNTAAKDALKEYIRTNTPNGTLTTDYERRAMALLALAVNPYDGTATNYIQKIVDAFDGTQIGEPALWNDDIFALIPLLHAGYGQHDDIIKKITAFVLNKQDPEGSWIGADMTAAAIQALQPLSAIDGVSSAIARAKDYLKAQERDNGSWNDSADSTSWSLQAIAALGESESLWIKKGNTPNDYLTGKQGPDGGIDDASLPTSVRVWSTAYAIPASLGKSWHSIMTQVDRQNSQTSLAPQSFFSGNSATTLTPISIPDATATSTLFTTSTPPVASTTIHVETDIPNNRSTGKESVSTTPVIPQVETPAHTALAQIQKVAGKKIEQPRGILPRAMPTTTTDMPADKKNMETETSRKPVNPIMLVAAAGALGLGMYLIWRFLRGIV